VKEVEDKLKKSEKILLGKKEKLSKAEKEVRVCFNYSCFIAKKYASAEVAL
jgi:hypothetical protein